MMIDIILFCLLSLISGDLEGNGKTHEHRINLSLNLIRNDKWANSFLFNGIYHPIDCFKVDSSSTYSSLTYSPCVDVINYYLDTTIYKTLADRVRYLRKQEVVRKQGYIPQKFDLSKIERYDSNCQYNIAIEIIHNNIFYISLSSEHTDGRFVLFFFVFDDKDSVIYSNTNYGKP